MNQDANSNIKSLTLKVIIFYYYISKNNFNDYHLKNIYFIIIIFTIKIYKYKSY